MYDHGICDSMSHLLCYTSTEKPSNYDQEIPHLQFMDLPLASRGRDMDDHRQRHVHKSKNPISLVA